MVESQLFAASKGGSQGDCDRTGDPCIGEQLAFAQQAVSDRLRTVHRAEVVVLVDATGVIGIVIEQVVCCVGEDQAKGDRQPGPNVEMRHRARRTDQPGRLK